MTGPIFRPMDRFDSSRPAVLHDSLNDEDVRYDPSRHRASWAGYARQHEPGVMEWDGRLIDGWRESDAPR